MNRIVGPETYGRKKGQLADGVQNSRGTYTISWVQGDGTPVALEGVTLTGYLYDPQLNEIVTLDGALTVVSDGTFTWEQGANDVAKAGKFEIQFKGVDGARSFFSYPQSWKVRDDLSSFPPGSWTGGLTGVSPAAASWLETVVAGASGLDDTYVVRPSGAWTMGLVPIPVTSDWSVANNVNEDIKAAFGLTDDGFPGVETTWCLLWWDTDNSAYKMGLLTNYSPRYIRAWQYLGTGNTQGYPQIGDPVYFMGVYEITDQF